MGSGVPDEGEKVSLFLTEDRLVAVLKQMSRPSMSFIEVHGIPCEKLSHDAGDAPVPALQ